MALMPQHIRRGFRKADARAHAADGLLAGDSSKDCIDRRLLHIREQMPIPSSHVLRRAANEIVDNPLIDRLLREVADEAMAQTVPAEESGKRKVCSGRLAGSSMSHITVANQWQDWLLGGNLRTIQQGLTAIGRESFVFGRTKDLWQIVSSGNLALRSHRGSKPNVRNRRRNKRVALVE